MPRSKEWQSQTSQQAQGLRREESSGHLPQGQGLKMNMTVAISAGAVSGEHRVRWVFSSVQKSEGKPGPARPWGEESGPGREMLVLGVSGT